jgi:hypothetical protein
MMRQALSIVAIALAIGGCKKGAKEDVLSNIDTTKVAYATYQCTEPNADGVRCDKKTCKKDAGSDCSVFKDRCTQSGHSYEGDNDAGTCTRGDQVG